MQCSRHAQGAAGPCPESHRHALLSAPLQSLVAIAMTSESPAPLVQLISVSRHYLDGDVHALKAVDLEIRVGEFLAIIGPSGGGKSTLLNMIGALDRPTSGQILFEGQDLAEMDDLDAFRASRLGFIFQSYYLLPNLTALENVQLTLFETMTSGKKRQARAAELLEKVGLAERANHLPNQLSIGQRQRVAIARAIANDPPLVLADEPTGALDSQRGGEVMDLLQQLRTDLGSTLVVVTHDIALAARADRTVEISDGVIRSNDTMEV